jgi:hypothetical protein
MPKSSREVEAKKFAASKDSLTGSMKGIYFTIRSF